MKQVYIVSVQPDPDGPVFGRAMQSEDFMKSQQFGHDHVTAIVKDLLVAGAAGAQVAGFAATLTGGLNVTVAKGDAIAANGVFYDTDVEEGDGSTALTLDAAHATLPRIDLIIATLSADVQVKNELKPFRRVRTLAELEAGVAPYPPTEYDVATELHSRAVVSIKKGTPNASPVAPVAGAGEVALFQIHVAATQTVLAGGDLTDVRPLITSLYTIAQYKPMLDAATSSATASTLMKRDSNGDVQTRDFKPTRQIVFPDTSIQRAAFVREGFYDLIDLDAPINFHAAVANTYETVKRQAMSTIPDTMYPVVSVDIAPEIDIYIDPADFVNVLFKLEAIMLHTADQPPTDRVNVNGSTLQLWNATAGASLATVSSTYVAVQSNPYRSSAFSIIGSGAQRLVLRARHDVDATSALLAIWRARLIINPSF